MCDLLDVMVDSMGCGSLGVSRQRTGLAWQDARSCSQLLRVVSCLTAHGVQCGCGKRGLGCVSMVDWLGRDLVV